MICFSLRSIAVWVFCVASLIGVTRTMAADDPTPDVPLSTQGTLAPDTVVAKVDDTPITVGDVETIAVPALQGRQMGRDALDHLQADILSQLVSRQLILKKLAKEGKTASSAEVAQALAQLKQQAAAQKIDFAKMLADRQVTEAQLKDQLAWQRSWTKYLEENLTEAKLKAYFEAHQREYDGSQVRVSHILLRPDGPITPTETERLTRQAEKLRDQIASGALKFEDAANKYSGGPSRHQAGDLGFIPRRGLMLEPFSAAAFQLKKGEISEPVATTYGVHLIRMTDYKAGRKSWSDVKSELQGPASLELFESLAAEMRKDAKIEFTGKMPYYKPGTKELVKSAE